MNYLVMMMNSELAKLLLKNKKIKEFVTKNAIDEKEILKNYNLFSQFQEMDDICSNCDKKECLSEVENMTCELLYEDGKVRCVYRDCNLVQKDDPNSLEVIDFTPNQGKPINTGPREKVFEKFKDFYTKYNQDNKGLVKGLYLHGKYGTGKSFIMYEFAKKLAKKNRKVIFVYYPDFVRRIQSSFGDGENVEDLVYRLKTCDVLFLDDLGRESNTSYIRDEILGPILQYRCDNFLPLFATSNRSFKLLVEHLADASGKIDNVKAKAIISRLEFLMDECLLDDEDFRKKENNQ